MTLQVVHCLGLVQRERWGLTGWPADQTLTSLTPRPSCARGPSSNKGRGSRIKQGPRPGGALGLP